MSGKEEQITLGMQAVTAIAAAAHAANAAYCRSLGDDGQPEWADAPDWQVSSAVNGVEFHLANPDAGDAASHDNWRKAKEAEGWKYGEKKDAKKKLHPCMVDFDKLPPEQQFKDALFRSIVHGLAPLLKPLEVDAEELHKLKSQNERLNLELEQANDAVKLAHKHAGEDHAAIEALTAERDAFKRSLSAQKGATTKTRNEVEQLKEASRPRAFGPVKIPADSVPLTAAELLELVADADQVELAFSNGRAEIPGVPPVRLTGEPLVLRRGTLRLATDSLQVTGPNTAKAPPSLAGFALVLDGEQVAWAPLSSPLSLGAGQTYELKDSVVFATR